jgi:hypothetical protein
MAKKRRARAPKPFRMWVQGRSGGWIFLALFLPFMLIPLVMLVLMSLMGSHWGSVVPWWSAAIYAYVPLVFLASFTRVEVRADGIRIRRGLSVRHLPFAAMASAREADGLVLRIGLRSGECVDVFTGVEEQLHKRRYVERCRELTRRVQQGITAQAVGEASPGGAVGLGLCDRAHALLRQRERASRVPYRTLPAPSPEELWGVVDDSSERPPRRAAAAAILGLQGDTATRARLRLASRATAHPGLGQLLRIASDGADDAAVERALAEIEAEPAASTERREG